MSSVTHHASGTAGLAEPKVYEKQSEPGREEKRRGDRVSERDGGESNGLPDMKRQRERLTREGGPTAEMRK